MSTDSPAAPLARTAPHPTPPPVALTVAGTVVATLDDGSAMPATDSPRPHLHPVRTLAGTPVSDSAPADHRHHRGVGLAVPDVDGTSHWGGRTHVRGKGSTMLGNHGAQHVVDQDGDGAGALRQLVTWCDRAGREQLREERRLRAVAAPGGWRLDWTSVLHAPRPLTVGSPATNGRPGAFYGGWFWRTPFDGAGTLVAGGTGTAHAHGSRSPWLAVTAPGAWLLAVQHGEALPWFVRTEEYTGFGPALAFDARREVGPEEPLRVRLSVLVADGPAPAPGAARAAALGLLATGVDA
ncbi:PmoA family protein [Paenibacillus sp. TRM 82003]|uniref:DUF6807 domain-containing protein n=1 Tax=Kineococcus sp. TRM81007 TaxID=2925831 RepID=UPI001F5AAAE6|nr:PmoA family protein [Kineococcus sp. TRM81007]MCI2236988.1 PmoA family protein [Kineococcus sp. TRM81007]MCI3926617.1 PmoA family protein [Paenibacillus sp. TRM 82003]